MVVERSGQLVAVSLYDFVRSEGRCIAMAFSYVAAGSF